MTDWSEIPPKNPWRSLQWLETCVTCDLWLHGESSHYLRAEWLIILRRAIVLRQIVSRYLSSINLIRRTQQVLLFEFSETCISWNDFASTDSDEEGKINYLWSQFSQNWHLDKKGGSFCTAKRSWSNLNPVPRKNIFVLFYNEVTITILYIVQFRRYMFFWSIGESKHCDLTPNCWYLRIKLHFQFL